MAHSFDFDEELAFSQTATIHDDVRAILLGSIAGATHVVRAGSSLDRSGIDYWVYLSNGMRAGVDTKIRRKDFFARFGRDDLALELWSVIEDRKIGWTLNEAKRTEYVLWLWQDTGRWCLVPFLLLCSTFQRRKEKWCRQYKHDIQKTMPGGYRSECVFVPRDVIWDAIREEFGGDPVKSGRLPRG